MGILRLWFGLEARVDRRTYAASGFGLVALKYAIDAAFVYLVAHRIWTPLHYLNPFFSVRNRELGSRNVLGLMVVIALPFLWIGFSMTVRRALDAGRSPLLSLLYFVPGVNYVLMLVLCCLPTREGEPWRPQPATPEVDDAMRAALLGIAAGLGIAVAMTLFSVYVLHGYGSALFLGTPVVIGATSAYLYNRTKQRSLGASLGVAVLAISIAGGSILVFGLEGLFCLAMAFPIAAGGAILGALVGRMVARGSGAPAQLAIVLFALPLLAGAESRLQPPAAGEVRSAIEIDAPPERVWPNVIGFSELPAPEEWMFRIGVSYPQRARIEGRGVGAVRHCEFSTGPFVEPITTWDEPRRLSFDVTAQPAPMEEWSPYRHIAPPHLDGYLRSRRGEFRLIALEDGRTRLEGSTYYELEMFPAPYWAFYSDHLIASIHGRVLRHIKRLSER